jgi:cell division initiation protein
MALTPGDVEQKAFTQALRGYHMDEVDDFLDEVVATLRSYDQRVRDAQDRIRALEGEMSNRGHDESTISRAFLAAQRSADSILSDAQIEAEQIRAGARTEADRLVADRDRERRMLLAEIAGMREAVEAVRVRLRELASSTSGDLDVMEQALDTAHTEVEQTPASIDDLPISISTVPAPPSIEESPIDDYEEEQMSEAESFEPSEAEPSEPNSVDLTEEAPRAGARPWERA